MHLSRFVRCSKGTTSTGSNPAVFASWVWLVCLSKRCHVLFLQRWKLALPCENNSKNPRSPPLYLSQEAHARVDLSTRRASHSTYLEKVHLLCYVFQSNNQPLAVKERHVFGRKAFVILIHKKIRIAVDSCLSCSNACGPLEVCVDGPCMEHFLILRQIEISPLIARKNPRAGSEATWIIPCTAESEIAFCGHPIAEHDEDGENVAENVNIIGTEDEIEHSPLEASAHEEPKLGSSEDQQINDRIRELQGPAHWGWAIGNFSFPDNGLENEYSQYICSEQNLQIMRVLMGVLVANAILSGVVDFGFYYECGILVNILEHWFLLARYGLLFPILVVAVIPLWRSYGPLELMSTEHTYLWSTSHYACLTNMVYLLIRTNLVYGDSDFTKHMDLWDLVHFHYGETLFVAIMIVGLPHSGSSVVKLSFFVWLVMGLANINLYARNIHAEDPSTRFMLSFSSTFLPFVIVCGLFFSRAQKGRLHFLSQKVLAEFLERCHHEQDVLDNALLWVYSQKIVNYLKTGADLHPHPYEIYPILYLKLHCHDSSTHNLTSSRFFEFTSDLFQALERICESSGLCIAQTFGLSAMIVPLESEFQRYDPTRITSVVECMLRMAQEVKFQTALMEPNRQIGSVEVSCGIDVGHVVSGLIGRKHFVYDHIGSPVTCAELACRAAAPSQTLATERIKRLLYGKTHFEFSEARRLQTQNDQFMLYKVVVNEDIEASFMSNVEWMKEDALIEKELIFDC
eukprot:TRINITY_DN1371_c0_g1_i23.p1 TRINITY_DN1371_c0_g1~~TRINITY_DN1371_c0_g1_i23.p1  ORF type:complete len:741 (-),score=71.31 TRINITY_DN1371_c0_g1_i23:317-2539(-)